MKEKKQVKVSMSGFFLAIAIIIIAVMGYFIYKISTEKEDKENQIASLNNEISSLQSSSRELQGKIDSIANTINTTKINETSINNGNTKKYKEITNNLGEDNAFYVTEVIDNGNTYTLRGTIYTKYTLTNNEVEELFKKGTMEINHGNGVEKYNVKKIEDVYYLYSQKDNIQSYLLDKKDSNTYYILRLAQMSDVWKLTNEQREITVDANIMIENGYSDMSISTVKEYFKDFKKREAIENDYPITSYNFEFKDGKCVKIIESVVGV